MLWQNIQQVACVTLKPASIRAAASSSCVSISFLFIISRIFLCLYSTGNYNRRGFWSSHPRRQHPTSHQDQRFGTLSLSFPKTFRISSFDISETGRLILTSEAAETRERSRADTKRTMLLLFFGLISLKILLVAICSHPLEGNFKHRPNFYCMRLISVCQCEHCPYSRLKFLQLRLVLAIFGMPTSFR